MLETESSGYFTLFDYNLYREITDKSPEYEICKTFVSYINDGDLLGFQKDANESSRKAVFDEKGNALTMNFWNNFVSRVGKCTSTNIYCKDEQHGGKSYSLAFHLAKAEVLMQLSFDNNSLINGFFILKILPKCNTQIVKLIPTGRNEYFIDGYSYGQDKDFRVKYDKSENKISFESGNEIFTASRQIN